MLYARWGKRVTLIDLYQLEACSRGVSVADLPQPFRDRLAERVLRQQWPGYSRGSTARRVREPVVILPYDRNWPGRYQGWRARVLDVLGDTAIRVEHVGSTAVPGLAAKPVIDIQVSVHRLDDEAAYVPQLGCIRVPLATRDGLHRYFCPPPEDPRAVQIHVCQVASEWERDHLLFRDYLRVEPSERRRYGALKREMARLWGEDRLAYTDAKSSYILDGMTRARAWAETSGWRVG